MGNLANKFLEAVNIISDAKTKSAGFDRSVQVTIKKLYQEDSTKYEVEYEGALKTATGAIGYKTNDVVWAVIPKNDLTQTLQIIGLVSSIAADKQVLRSEDDKFEKVTPNLATFETEWNLPYEDEDKEIQFIKTIWSATGSDNDNLITLQASKVIDAIQSSLYFEIGVIFESSINLNTDTNFGIRCYCNGVTDKPKFVLDINDIIGNPYNLIGEQQKKVFEITDKTDLTSFDKIDFFAESLGEKDKITLTSFSFYGCRDVDYMTGLAANLLVSETGTDFRELGGLSINNYNLIDADNLIFKANLRYDGILVTENELSKYTYKWYLKTLKDGLPLRMVAIDEAKYASTTANWTIDNINGENARLVKYKGKDDIVYIPTTIKGHWKQQNYDVKEKDPSAEEKIAAFPAKGETNILYCATNGEEEDQYYIWQDNKYVEQTSTEVESIQKLLDNKTYHITVIGDGENSLFNLSNNIEAIVINTKATIIEPDAENKEAPFSNLSDDVVIYGNIRTDHRKISDGWFNSVTDAPNQLNVSATALFMPDSWIWCEVVDEKGNKAKTVEGWIDNADKSYDLQLIAPTPKPDEETGKFSSTLTIKQIAKDENGEGIDPPPGLVYKWFKDGIEMVDEEQEDKPPIRTPSITIFAEDHEYRCEVYTINNFLMFMETYKSVFIPDVPAMEQDSVIITGQTVYLCKANGEFIGQMSPLKAWFYKEGTLVTETDLTKYSFQWDIPDDEITMLKVVTPLNQQETTFSAKQYLLNEYTNNTVSVSVSDSSGKIIASTSVEITFLKNGQPGTNGTDIICYFEKDGQALNYYGGNIDDITASNVVVRRASQETNISVDETSLEYIPSKDAPIYLKATCKAGDSIWYAYLLIVKYSNSEDFKLIEPTGSLYVQFSSGGKIAENLPLLFTANKEITEATLSSYNYFQINGTGNNRNILLSNNFEAFKGDKNYEILTLTHSSGSTIQIPILLLTNRFEYAAINGWDGTSIKLDETNNTVLAPMAGFGKKEEDNSFTGVVLGNITSDSNEDTFQGLIGMYQSERTFSLNANDGSAWFKGHVEATSGKIGEVAIDAVMSTNISDNYSWRFSPTEGLFMWKGAQGTISSDDPTGGALFSITENGLHMKGSGTFEGEINVTQGGTIGAFTIGGDKNSGTAFIKTAEFSGTTSGLYFGTSGLRIGGNFSVDSSGEIAAKSGTIGAFKIQNTGSLLLSNNVDDSISGNYYLKIENTNTHYSSYISSGQIYTRYQNGEHPTEVRLSRVGLSEPCIKFYSNKGGAGQGQGSILYKFGSNLEKGGLILSASALSPSTQPPIKYPVYIYDTLAEVMTVGSHGHITASQLTALINLANTVNGGVINNPNEYQDTSAQDVKFVYGLATAITT